MTAFTRDFGVHQGRITVDGNAHVYELGHALLARANVVIGDFHEVMQQFVVDSTEAIVRARIVIVTPSELPEAAAWELSAWLNETKMVSRRLHPSKRPIELCDLAVSLCNASAPPNASQLVFRLELVKAFSASIRSGARVIQLPSVQIDLVEELPYSSPLIANRDPQPDALQVALHAAICFDHLVSTGLRPELKFFVIRVGDVIAFSDEAPHNGWDVRIEYPDDATTRFALRAPQAFVQGVAVNLQVVVTATGDAWSWSFAAADTAAPAVTETVAVDVDRVLVRFSEPVSMENAALEHDALNPDRYVVERVSMPAATPSVTAVQRLSASEVMLTMQFELTYGASYLLVVGQVADEFGNVILPPGNVAAFTAYQPPFPAGRRFLIHNFVPAIALDADASNDLQLFLACVQDSVNVLLHSIDRWTDILDPDRAPEPFVDAMLADLSNPFTFELGDVDKRKLAKLLTRIYELKGTVIGIVDVVRFFLSIEVGVEVFNGSGWVLGAHALSMRQLWGIATSEHAKPAVIGAGSSAIYSFRVTTAAILTATQRQMIRDIVVYMKGSQEHLVDVRDGTPVPVVFPYLKLGETRLGRSAIFRG